MIEPTKFFSAAFPCLAGLQAFTLENSPILLSLYARHDATSCEAERWVNEFILRPEEYAAKTVYGILWATVDSHVQITSWPVFENLLLHVWSTSISSDFLITDPMTTHRKTSVLDQPLDIKANLGYPAKRKNAF